MGISRTENTQKLIEIYSSADVYVNASVEETMGLTTVEAMATGTPAIVYNATALPEVVDEKSGVIVSAGDINALYKTIVNMNLKSEDCILKAKDFEKNKQYELYMELYEKILNNRC